MTIPPCYEPHLLTRHPAEFYGTAGPSGVIRQANEAVRSVAKESGAVLVDLNVLFTVLGEIGPGAGCVLRNEANSKSADGVHPTAAGYRLIATAVFQAIQDRQLPHAKIVCFGDSITFGANMAGAGKAEGDTYPGYLARLLAAAPVAAP